MLDLATLEDRAPEDQATLRFHSPDLFFIPPEQMAPHSLWEHEKTLAFHRLKLLELKRHAELVHMAYAKEVKTPAEMTAAELREQLEMRNTFHMMQLRELNELERQVELANMVYAKEVKYPAE